MHVEDFSSSPDIWLVSFSSILCHDVLFGMLTFRPVKLYYETPDINNMRACSTSGLDEI